MNETIAQLSKQKLLDEETPKSSGIILPIIFIGIMYFSLGFGLGINSFLIPVLQTSFNISSGISYLVLAATFSTFIIFSFPATRVIMRIGYKYTMALSFNIYAIGFVVYILSAQFEVFWIFLIASFISGTGNTFLQAAINPYITILGPIESGAQRIGMMSICNKIAWSVAPTFLSLVIGKDASKTQISDLFTPLYIILGIFLLLGIFSILISLPDVKAPGEDNSTLTEECTYAGGKTSIWQFPHLWLGTIALFFYVGVETVSLSTLIEYANSIGLENSQYFSWLSSAGMVVGCLFGICFIPRWISQSFALKICSWIGVFSVFLVTLTPEKISIWCTILMALSCSLMWPSIWPLAMSNLGPFTKTGSSLMVMAIAGGAVIPTGFGFIKDSYGKK